MAGARNTLREKNNWLIHQRYVRREFGSCMRLIDEQLEASGGLSEYPLYVKGLVRRQQGRVTESLQLFQAALCLAPKSVRILKQVARSLQLLGKHRHALDVLEQAVVCGGDEDWEVFHAKGLCYLFRRDLANAIDAFEEANSIHRHDETYIQLGKAHELDGNLTSAMETYLEALEFLPDSTEILTTVGLLYMRQGDTEKAFEFLGNSLTHDPRDPKTILAAGCIIQDHRDFAVALTKYRIAAQRTPHNPHLWNNIGLCFFGLEKFIAAVACLKRAAYLAPFEWIVQYNLGIVHLRTSQNASAYHHLSAAVQLNRRFAAGYHYLAVALARLEDIDNAMTMFERAIKLQESVRPSRVCCRCCSLPLPSHRVNALVVTRAQRVVSRSDYQVRLNYAICLANADKTVLALEQYHEFVRGLEAASAEADEEEDDALSDPDIVMRRDALVKVLNIM